MVSLGATLVLWPDIRTWTNASMCLLCTEDALVSNLVIRGPGTIDGQGWRWYGISIAFGREIERGIVEPWRIQRDGESGRYRD